MYQYECICGHDSILHSYVHGCSACACTGFILKRAVADPPVREFSTGATRDVDTGKLDYEAFLNPLVLERFAQFMHKNRFQKDGSLRAGDNWQKGIPLEAYAKSLNRHHMDLWLHHRGYGYKATDPDIEEVLCAIMFNAMGYLKEVLEKNGS